MPRKYLIRPKSVISHSFSIERFHSWIIELLLPVNIRSSTYKERKNTSPREFPFAYKVNKGISQILLGWKVCINNSFIPCSRGLLQSVKSLLQFVYLLFFSVSFNTLVVVQDKLLLQVSHSRMRPPIWCIFHLRWAASEIVSFSLVSRLGQRPTRSQSHAFAYSPSRPTLLYRAAPFAFLFVIPI